MVYTETIKKNGDFTRIYKTGRYYTGKYLILYILDKSRGKDCLLRNALGVTASKKVGKSVRRNRLRRIIKENYRYFEMYIRRGVLAVFVVRPPHGGYVPDFYNIRRDMKGLFVRAGVFDLRKWEESQKGDSCPL